MQVLSIVHSIVQRAPRIAAHIILHTTVPSAISSAEHREREGAHTHTHTFVITI